MQEHTSSGDLKTKKSGRDPSGWIPAAYMLFRLSNPCKPAKCSRNPRLEGYALPSTAEFTSSPARWYSSRTAISIFSRESGEIGCAMSRNSPSGLLLLGMATNMPLLPSITRISCTTNSPSIVIEAIARILPSRVTRRSRTSVISNLLHHPFPEMMYFTYSTWMVYSLQDTAKNS